MNKFFIISLVFLYSCTSEMSEFFLQKVEMERIFGPCSWKYVGIDTKIIYPAIKITPPNGNEYVLWNQICNLNN